MAPVPPGANDRNIGLIGAGNFARMVLVPAIKESGLGTIKAVASAGGTSAAKLAEQLGAVAMTPDELLADSSIGLVVIATPHDTHANLTVRALDAGKHVFCEKPLALTQDELDDVVAAWERSGKQLAVGFNRRHSPWIKKTQAVFAKSAGPLVITYRVSAGTLPAKHWYHDRTQGGRLIGEVCHFVDTCNALVDKPVVRVSAVSAGRTETQLDENLVVSLTYEDGSVAAITYATGGHASTGKERIEILGRGHTVVIDDFASMSTDGQKEPGAADKGHVAQLSTRRGSADWRESTVGSINSMSCTIKAAAAISGCTTPAPTGDQ
jgi:predicted dehydrogenase